MAWEPWPQRDPPGLARYVTAEASRFLRLEVSPVEFQGQVDGQRRLVEAIYTALLGRHIRYALEEYHPEEASQRIRTPDKVLEAPGWGTCLDLATLFCGVCLACDLLPLLIMLEGHALAAVSLRHWLRGRRNRLEGWRYRPEYEDFEAGPLKDPSPLRRLIDEGDYLAVECTGFAHLSSVAVEARREVGFRLSTSQYPETVGRVDGVLPFARAWAAGREQLDGLDRPLRFALDIAIAHYKWNIDSYLPEKPGASAIKVENLIVSALEKKIDPLVGAIGSTEIHALAANLAQVTWTQPTLFRAYCAAVGQLSLDEMAEFARADSEAVLAEMLADLLRRTGGKQRPLLEFLGRLSKSMEAQAVSGVLIELVNHTATAFGLSEGELYDLWTQVVSRPAPIGGTRPVLLLVLEPSGRPKSPLFSLRALLMTDQYRRTLFVDDIARKRKEVEEQIGQLLRVIDTSSELAQEQPLVAFCLPRQLWGMGVDQWEIDVGGGITVEIGVNYRVVLCSQERIAADAQQVPTLGEWKRRWESKDERPLRMLWLNSPDECRDRKSIYLRLVQGDIACLALAILPPRRSTRCADPFEVALVAGTPIILWVRTNGFALETIQQELGSVLQQEIAALPERLKDRRALAMQAGAASIWPHVVLLWDSPEFRPSRLRLRRPDDGTARSVG